MTEYLHQHHAHDAQADWAIQVSQAAPHAPVVYRLKILRPLITPPDPLPQRLVIPRPKPNFELLRLSSQAGLDGIALQGIQDRLVALVFRWEDVKSADKSDKGSVELSVR